METLGVIGFLGFLVCIVLLIIALVKKTGKAKQWGIGIAVCFILFLVGAINSSSKTDDVAASNATTHDQQQDNSVTASTTVSNATSKVEPAEQPKEDAPVKIETYKIGDSIESGEMIFTVNSVREIKGNDLFKPNEGNIYYAIDATVENKSDASQTVSSIMMFKLIDSDAYSYSIVIGPETKGQLDGEIAAGRKLRGELAYEIPEKAKGLELEIDPSIWGLGKIIYKLDR